MTAAATVLSLTAQDEPRPGTAGVAPRHRYRLPRLQLETRELGPLAADHVRFEMLYAGVCGTDLHLLQTDAAGYISTSAPAALPPEGRVIGHEGIGRVAGVGDSAQEIRCGDIAAFASILACHQCQVCRRGALNQCPHGRLLGMEMDGLFGTVVDVPASLVYPVTDTIRHDDDLKALACLEPAGVALLACRNGRVQRGDSVLVLGGGPIGLLCAIICREALGAGRVELVEPIAGRRRLAADWCDAVYDVDDYLGQARHPVDVVLECSGDLTNMSRLFAGIQPSGRVVLLGRSGAPLVIDNVDHLITGAISIIGSRGHLGVLADVVHLYRSGRLPLAAIVTGELDSLEALHSNLVAADDIAQKHCKLLARIGPP